MKVLTTVMVPSGGDVSNSEMPIEFSNDNMATGYVKFTVNSQSYVMPCDEMASIAYFLRNTNEEL